MGHQCGIAPADAHSWHVDCRLLVVVDCRSLFVGYVLVPSDRFKSLHAQEEFPTYNFIGLLIGPRGNTQKRMQVCAVDV